MLKTPMTLNHISEQLGFDEAHCRRLLRATTTLKLTRALPDHHYGLGSHGAALLANPGLLQLIEHHQMFYQDLADPIALFTGSAPNSASVNDAGGNKNTGGGNSLGSGRIDDASSHLGTYWAYAGNADPTIRDASAADQVADYSALMAASQPMVSAQVLHCYSFSNHVRLLDLGVTFLRIRYQQTLILFHWYAYFTITMMMQSCTCYVKCTRYSLTRGPF